METQDYYRTHHKEYFDGTSASGIDPSSFLSPFLEYLPKNSTVLDVGCGSGRDMKWFKEKGFEALGFERSPELARHARAHSCCDVIVGDFEDFDFGAFDVRGILLVGCLVHVPHAKVPHLFRRIAKAIRRPPGFIFLSMKKGSGKSADARGRVFYLWDQARLLNTLEDDAFKVLDCRVNRSEYNSEDQWISLIIEKRADHE